MRYRPWRGPTIPSCKLNMEYSEECIIKSHYCTYMYYFLLWISDTEEKSIRIWKIEPVWMSNIWNSFKYLSFQRSQRKISNYLRKQIDPRIGKRRGLEGWIFEDKEAQVVGNCVDAYNNVIAAWKRHSHFVTSSDPSSSSSPSLSTTKGSSANIDNL